MVRITSIALVAFATSALAVPAKPGFDATPEVGREHALVLRQEPPPAEPPVEEPKPEEVKTANADLAVLLQNILDVMGSLNEDIKQGKVQLNTETKLSPEEQKIALENIQKGIFQSAQTLVEIGKPLIEGEGEDKAEPAPEAK
ncbi:hypothetical protein MGU_11769 [Metarhizium guizhouense ARSEF 977]|uniref:Cell wall protein n=1 Tax=Metarhizium guizhouense (strain ARSEF 977) TaxID=1276136 RepID=A0A0B4GLR4_METGA|nr:hypothetical protein MGU_11769 [Metarhizium guizhouense ARSEF 977]